MWFRRYAQAEGFKAAVQWRDSGKAIPQGDEARAYVKAQAKPSQMMVTSRSAALLFAFWLSVCSYTNSANAQTVTFRANPSIATKHVLILPTMRTAGQSATLPWLKAAEAFNAQGIVLAIVNENEGVTLGRNQILPSLVSSRVQLGLEEVKKTYPGVPTHLIGFGFSAAPLLDVSRGLSEIKRVIIAAGDFRASRTADWTNHRQPVLLLHAPTSQCDIAPFYEANLIASKNRFAMVRVGYQKTDSRLICASPSHHLFSDLEVAMVQVIANWLDGQTVPSFIGQSDAPLAWREQVVQYAVSALLGSNLLEMSVLFPDGQGPFPIAVFNHGDIDIESPYFKTKSRYIDLLVAREFLRLGWAVAFPSRRGVGLSEGTYPRAFATNDGDAGYKARVHAQDILPALDSLRTMPLVDSKNVVMMGQSAGGYSVMHIGTLDVPGLKGIINFSGGRTDATGVSSASDLNKTMVNGFETFGAAAKYPVLMIFAEQDSRYSVNTIKASHQAFVAAGGAATLVLGPASGGDGHFVYQKPGVWRDALMKFLTALQVKE